MLKELDAVMLVRDLPENGLARGDVGTIVASHRDGEGYEVEFVSSLGDTLALLTLAPADVRPLPGKFIQQVRELAPA